MLHKTIRKSYLNNTNYNIKIYQIVKMMHGNIHTHKFQYTALETRKYDKLKTTETDNGNYLSHEKRVIQSSLLYTHVKSSIFLQNHIPKKLLAKVLTLTILGSFFSGKSLFDSDRTTLLFDIKPSSLDTFFPGTEGRRYSTKWEGKFPWLRYSNHKDAEFL